MKTVSRCQRISGAFALVAVAVALATPLAAAYGSGSAPDIVTRLEKAGKFTILLKALETANLEQTLANDGPFTVFAPTDAAFAALLSEFSVSAEELLADPALTEILLYHVAGGSLRAGDLLRASTQPTLSDGKPVLVIFERFRVKVNDSNVIRADVKAKNGVIHYIDRVLLPPVDPIAIESLVDVLRLDGRFSILLAALEKTNLDDALAMDGPFTLFAPTDAAFGDLLAQLGITAPELLDDPSLPSILLYHVAQGRKGAFQLLLNGGTSTLEGGQLRVRLRAGGVFVNNSKLLNPNINAPNGVIHTIDAVLLP